MNIPRTKKPKRFSPIRKSTKSPAGDYTTGIKNPAFAERMGFLIGYWPHVEEAMIEIVQDLLGGDEAMPSRQIFYGMVANAARIDVLRAILEEGPLNATKDEFYDKTIDEYKSLNKIRNGYIHGLWHTHTSGRIFISARTTDDLHFMEQREDEQERLRISKGFQF